MMRPPVKIIRSLLLLVSAASLLITVPTQAEAAQTVPISVANAGQLKQVKMIGRGATNPGLPLLNWSPDGQHLVTLTNAGLWLFDSAAPAEQGLFIAHAQAPIAISPNSQYLAYTTFTATEQALVDYHVTIIAVASGQPVLNRAYPGSLYGLTFSPDSKQLILSGDDQKPITEVWTINTGDSTAAQSIPFTSDRTQYLPRLGLLALFGANEIQLWDLSTLQLKRRIQGVQLYSVPILVPDASLFVSSNNNDGNILVTNSATKHALQVGKGSTPSYALSPDGSLLATPSPDDDKQILLWGTSVNHPIRYLKGHTGSVLEEAYSPNGQLLASASDDDDTTRLWDVNSGKELRQVVSGGHHVFDLVFSPDSRSIAGFSKQGQLIVQAVATGTPLAQWGDFYDAVTSVAFNGSLLAAISSYPESGSPVLLFWLAGQDKPLSQPGTTTYSDAALRFSADGTRLISPGDGLVRFWDGKTGQLLNLWTFNNSGTTAALNTDGSQLAEADPFNQGVESHIWDTATGRLIRTFPTSPRPISYLTYSPDGKVLATVDNAIHLWNVDTGELLQTLAAPIFPQPRFVATDGIVTLMFGRDGTSIVSADRDGFVALWDTESGKQLTAIDTKMKNSSAALSPDGRLIATGSYNGISLWDSSTGKSFGTFQGDAGEVNAVTFSPDGSELITANQDGTIRIWAVSSK